MKYRKNGTHITRIERDVEPSYYDDSGNCYPDGRDVMRKTGMLKFLNPGEKKEYKVKIRLSQVK